MDGFPLSPQQRHIRSWSRTGSTHDAGCVIDLDGELRVDRLLSALDAVVGRHESLRTTFVEHTPRAEAVQVVAATGTYSLRLADEESAPDWWDRYVAREPDLGPVLRATLVRRGPSRHLLVLTLPVLCADGPSLRNLAREIARDYDAVGDGSEVMQYTHYAAWQNALAEDDGEQPPGNRPTPAQVRTLPFEIMPAHRDTYRYAAHSVRLDPDATTRIDAAAADAKATPARFLLGCWQTLLWQQTRAEEVEVGLVTDGRVYDELEPVIGPCSTVLPVRIALTGTDRFAEVLDRTSGTVEQAVADQEHFTWDDDPAATAHPVWGFEFTDLDPAATAGGVTFTPLEQVAWTGPFTLKLHCLRHADALRVVLEYRSDTFDEAGVRCLLDQVLTLAESAAADQDALIGVLNAVSPAQARRLAATFAPAARAYPDRCAHQLVEAQASTTPDRVAIVADGVPTTYAELNARANRLARLLLELGAGPEVLVGICLERGVDMVAAVIAVHKAGAAYVPLDPTHPGDRIRGIVEDTRMPILISEESSARGLPESGWRTVLVDRDHAAIAAREATDLNLDADPARLAYVLHTSGSTGRPKGVQVPHRAFVNFLHSMRERPGITADDSLVAVTTLSFDIAGLELYLPLTVGARVTLATGRTASDPHGLARLLHEAGATVLQATPVTWRMLVTSGWAGDAGLTALIGGEALPPELVAGVLPRVRAVWNMYGPTETTIWSTCARIGSADVPVTVGTPIANTCVHVLDANLRPVAAGVVGELCIGGVGVARGYAGRPDLTAERFIPDPICGTPGARMYRTGDLARYDAHGRLQVLGRTDSQVKIRGFRIELGEVETALARHSQVRAAVATTRPDPSGELRLDAYVLPSPGSRPRPGELRAHLKDQLPAPMVPSRIGVLMSFPLTANGKVDRAALPEITGEGGPGAGHVPARSELERTVADVWSAVLDVEQPGATDNFFDLGGHSVLLARAAVLLAERIGADITPLTLLEHPTIAALARHLDQRGTTESAAGESEAARETGRDRLTRRRSRLGER